MGVWGDREVSQLEKDLEFQKVEEGRTFKWFVAVGLTAIGAGLVALYGPDYARSLATVGTEVGALAFLSYGLYRVFSGRA